MNNSQTRAGVVAALTLTLAACGGGTSSSESEPVVDVTTTTSKITTIAPSPAAATPSTTEAAAIPVAAAADASPVAAIAPVDVSPAVAAFAEDHSALIADWEASIAAFGDEALDYIDDVSKAPSATSARESSDLVVDAIDPDTDDPSLMIVRRFAAGLSSAVTYAADGDQGAAMSVFLQLQGDAETITTVLAQLQA